MKRSPISGLLALVLAPVLVGCSPDRTPPARSHADHVRADFLKLIDRPKAPATAEILSSTANANLEELHFRYATQPGIAVPGILIRTVGTQGRHPAIIALHGTGGRKEDELPLLRTLAARGFIAVAVDGPFHGERSKAGKGTADYFAAIDRAYSDGHGNAGHPLYFDTVWDMMRLIDYLQTRPDVDPNRIGMYGVSKGGIETYLTAAMDERVKVAVPCIGMQSFSWALANNAWQGRISTFQAAFDAAAKDANISHPDTAFVRQFYSRVSPGIASEFDGPEMVRLIAPRPLLSINGDTDPRTPIPGLQECIASADAAYKSAGAPEQFLARIQKNTGHKVNPDSQAVAVEWFARWLKP